MVGGAERLPFSGRAGRDYGVGIARFSGLEQMPHQIGAQAGHIAGGDQIPVRGGMTQCREDAAERAFTGVEIRNETKNESQPCRAARLPAWPDL